MVFHCFPLMFTCFRRVFGRIPSFSVDVWRVSMLSGGLRVHVMPKPQSLGGVSGDRLRAWRLRLGRPRRRFWLQKL